VNYPNDFREKLLKEDLYHINAAEYAAKIRNQEDAVIWGCATAGQYVYDFLMEFDSLDTVKYFADNNTEKWGTQNNGLPVLSPQEVLKKMEENPDTHIIIASEHLSDIRKQLISLGIKAGAIDIKGFGLAKDYLTFNNKTPYQIVKAHIDDYEKAYSYLSDQRSQDIYLGILNSKISLDNKYLQDIAAPAIEQYFDKEIIKINEDEVFCDCGSYNGDTLEAFISLTDGKYEKYIAVEADEEIFIELNKKVAEKGYESVQTHNVACWNEKTILKFQPSRFSGHITEFEGISVCADTLDNILKDEKVTFLKMDIEGAEEMALKGAGNVILKNQPILAICIYHSLEDYYKLPLMMKDFNQDYRLLIRSYRDLVDIETVCYAIPKERLVHDVWG